MGTCGRKCPCYQLYDLASVYQFTCRQLLLATILQNTTHKVANVFLARHCDAGLPKVYQMSSEWEDPILSENKKDNSKKRCEEEQISVVRLNTFALCSCGHKPSKSADVDLLTQATPFLTRMPGCARTASDRARWRSQRRSGRSPSATDFLSRP